MDDEGFLYPEVDLSSCTDCGKCDHACAHHTEERFLSGPEYPQVYAAKNKDEIARMNSTSGGAFTALSDYILGNNGVVFGVKFDKDLNAVTTYAEATQERDEFRGSKYMQSNLGDSFIRVREFLGSGRMVMFTGTPCQTAALSYYCKEDETENLFLCDFICHGTPPQSLFHDHIQFLEEIEQDKIENYYHRSKENGWHKHTELQVYHSGKRDCQSLESRNYKNLYYSNLAHRPSCYRCEYTSTKRPSDITIADFWGIERSMPDYDDDKGVSLMLVNTEKGQKWLAGAEGTLLLRPSSIADCMQTMLQRPVGMPAKRQQFWIDYSTKGFKYIVRKYGGYNNKSRLQRVVKVVLSKLGLFELALRARKSIKQNP